MGTGEPFEVIKEEIQRYKKAVEALHEATLNFEIARKNLKFNKQSLIEHCKECLDTWENVEGMDDVRLQVYSKCNKCDFLKQMEKISECLKE
jgi:hypothetical protein